MKLEVRRAGSQDLELYLAWANDPLVRKNSFENHPIHRRDHQDWFSEKIKSRDSFLYVIENNGTPIGQVRFEIEGDDAWIAYTLDRYFRGQGLGRRLLKSAIDVFRIERKGALRLMAKVKNMNYPSIQVFKKLGFAVISDQSAYCLFAYKLQR